QKARERIIADREQNIELTKGPLLKVTLFRLQQEKYALSLILHHIVCDAISMDVMIRELLEYYGAFSQDGNDPFNPLNIHYKDFAQWQNKELSGEKLEKLKEYWRRQLEGELPELELPIDNPYPGEITNQGGEYSPDIDEELTLKLKALGKQNGATLFMVLLAALKTLLYHFTGQSDIVIGTFVTGREHTDLEEQIGFYLNTLALRTRFDPGDTYLDLLINVKTVLLEAYKHQMYPFDNVVADLRIKREAGRSPVFDVVVDMKYLTPQKDPVENIKIHRFETGSGKVKYILALDIAEGKNNLNIN
ncbi:MAG: non-ribosomal peptide synthetase, partial [bacterium]|nr:non-ribosomal peptide synthetase [bacterium]